MPDHTSPTPFSGHFGFWRYRQSSFAPVGFPLSGTHGYQTLRHWGVDGEIARTNTWPTVVQVRVRPTAGGCAGLRNHHTLPAPVSGHFWFWRLPAAILPLFVTGMINTAIDKTSICRWGTSFFHKNYPLRDTSRVSREVIPVQLDDDDIAWGMRQRLHISFIKFSFIKNANNPES